MKEWARDSDVSQTSNNTAVISNEIFTEYLLHHISTRLDTKTIKLFPNSLLVGRGILKIFLSTSTERETNS